MPAEAELGCTTSSSLLGTRGPADTVLLDETPAEAVESANRTGWEDPGLGAKPYSLRKHIAIWRCEFRLVPGLRLRPYVRPWVSQARVIRRAHCRLGDTK